MDLQLSAEYEDFRSRVKAFLAEHWCADEDGDREEAVAAFRRKAIEHGYLYRGFPKKYGGSEQPADVIKAQIIREEFGKADAPGEVMGVGTQMLAPTLLEHGEDWQKEKFIPKTLTGDYRWCQGYSEPNAGSDLASLRTRAELVGDDWIINGQKVWTSYAHRAHFMFALVRTEPQRPKHAGLSYLLIDIQQPGVVIRPLTQITGGVEFNEVFFEDARTPASWLVGGRGDGWAVSRSLLKHERNMLGGLDRSEALFDSLVKLAKRSRITGAPALEDPQIRDRLAALKAQLEAQRLSSFIQVTREARGESGGFLQLTNKLVQSNFAASVAELAVELMQNDALLDPRGGDRPGNERWVNQYMNSLAAAIAGGTSNIQRNIIAERGLGLPRERRVAQAEEVA